MTDVEYIAALEECIMIRDEIIERYVKIVDGWEVLYAKHNQKEV